MKKIIWPTICALLCCALLAGCGGSGDSAPSAAESETLQESVSAAAAGESVTADETAGTAAAATAPDSRYTFAFRGVEVAVNGDMAPLAEALGEPTSYFESESCAFQGLDKVYTYGGVIIRTYPEDGKDYVLSVELKDDSVTTREGVYIGQSRDDVAAVYGEPGQETDAALVYVDGDCTLTFLLADGTVTDITYTSDAA